MRRSAVLAFAVILAGAGLAGRELVAAPFTGLYVFGDSLSDIGNGALAVPADAPPSPPPVGWHSSASPHRAGAAASLATAFCHSRTFSRWLLADRPD